AEADNGRDALRIAVELLPDIVVMDIAMPDMNGIEATRRIIGANPDAKVLALSMHKEKRLIFEMFDAGAKGYLLKECAFEEVMRAIRVVQRGEMYLSPKITGSILADYLGRMHDEAKTAHPSLTPREKEILQLIAEGKNAKEIAFLLGVSVSTVDTFRHLIMKKLKLKTVAELTRYAISEGISFIG
ncbi:MAG TPA: response regulator transcription factor, partial [Geobacteraceae bacterium]